MADDFWQNDPVAAPAAAVAPRAPTDVSIRIRDASAAPPAEDWWHGDPVVDTGPSLGHEAAAVGITGPVRGLTAMAGMGGDLAELGKAGADKLAGYLPDIPSPAPDSTLGRLYQFLKDESAKSAKLPAGHVGSGDLPGSYVPPTSAELEKSLTNVTGPLPEAQTGAGKVGQAITEFVPAALTGGEGVASNLIKGAVLPGAGSELLGSKVEGTWLEPYARLLGALGGGVTGMAGSKGAELMANRSAATKAGTQLGPDINNGAVTRLANSYQADNLTPEIAAARAAAMGPEAMMMDTGRQMLGRAEAGASVPGKGQNTILDAVESRVHGTDEFGQALHEFGGETANRIKDTLDQTMGPSPDLVATRNGINDAVDKHATPLYKSVMDAHPVVDVPSSITSRPVVAQAMKDAEKLAKNYGENITGTTETQTELAGPGYHIANDVAIPAKTSLRYWDYVKKALGLPHQWHAENRWDSGTGFGWKSRFGWPDGRQKGARDPSRQCY